ncbi:MAG: HD domain-containing protein [Actinobacteria bacterium]|nr:HD domain-containing protein [Actinomycetota bacterium]
MQNIKLSEKQKFDLNHKIELIDKLKKFQIKDNYDLNLFFEEVASTTSKIFDESVVVLHLFDPGTFKIYFHATSRKSVSLLQAIQKIKKLPKILIKLIEETDYPIKIFDSKKQFKTLSKFFTYCAKSNIMVVPIKLKSLSLGVILVSDIREQRWDFLANSLCSNVINIIKSSRLFEKIESKLNFLKSFENKVASDIINSAPIGILILNKELNVIRANPEICKITKLNEKVLIGSTLSKIFLGNSFSQIKFLKRIIEDKPFVIDEFPHKTTEADENLILSMKMSSIKNANGELENIIMLVEDVTEKHNLLTQLNENMVSTIKTLGYLLEAKDKYTGDHSKNIVSSSLAMAQVIGLSGKEVRDIELAASIHDIGKIGIRGTILNKPGKLTEEEFEEVRQHSIIGANALSGNKELQNVAKIIRHHHEHYDGTGYPDGLNGEEIPVGSRIIFIADAFDAIISDRPYRKAKSTREARDILISGREREFDPALVDIFLKITHSEKYQ